MLESAFGNGSGALIVVYGYAAARPVIITAAVIAVFRSV